MSNIIKSTSPDLTYLTETNAFLTATGITDPIQSMAINELISDLMAFGLWSKMIAIYPIVGGTAETHKYNLKNPVDSDAAFRIVFSGGIVHSDTGMLGGFGMYGDTKIIPSVHLPLNDAHLSFYARTAGTLGSIELGCQQNDKGPFTALWCKYINNFFYGDINQTVEDGVLHTFAGAYFLATRTASNVKKAVINGNVVLNGTAVSTSQPTVPLYILAYNNGSNVAIKNSNKQCAFATIGYGLSVQQSADLYTCVQKFQGYLNRAI